MSETIKERGREREEERRERGRLGIMYMGR